MGEGKYMGAKYNVIRDDEDYYYGEATYRNEILFPSNVAGIWGTHFKAKNMKEAEKKFKKSLKKEVESFND